MVTFLCFSLRAVIPNPAKTGFTTSRISSKRNLQPVPEGIADSAKPVLSCKGAKDAEPQKLRSTLATGGPNPKSEMRDPRSEIRDP